jgi:DNA polymerase III subunit gamma/tau
MLARFPRLSRLATKVLEIAGAACASTFAAVMLGNSREPPRPPAPAVVQLAPADEQMIRHVREESVALAEQLRSASDARNAVPATPAAATPAATAKPAKAAASAPARKEQKASRTPTGEAKQRTAESLPVQSATAAPEWEPARVPPPAWEAARVAPAAGDARDGRITATAAAPADAGLPATPTAVPSRLWPAAASSLRDAPRPPLGVGEFLSSSM